MNAFITEEKQRSYMEQQLPLAAGAEVRLKAERCSPRYLFPHQPAERGAKDRLIQAILHKLCIQRSTATRQYRRVLFRDRESLFSPKTCGTAHRTQHRSKQNPLEQNKYTGMQTELFSLFFVLFCFLHHQHYTRCFSLE